MNDMPLGPAGPFEEETPRRDVVRAVGAAGAALLGTLGLGAIAAEARGKKRGKRGKKGKRGPTGPAGPPADITSQQVSSEPPATVNPNIEAVTSSNVECPAGTTATGGGFELASVLPGDFATIAVVSSQLHLNGWRVSVIRTSQPGVSDGIELTVHAICTSAG